MIGYMTRTFRPRAVAWECAINNQLLTKKGRHKYFAEFNLDGILRADTKSRYEAYNIGRNAGFLSANDIRRKENMSQLDPEIGDTYWTPANMIDAGEKVTPDDSAAAAARADWTFSSNGDGNHAD